MRTEERMTLQDAARVLGISEQTARRWIKMGKLKAYKPGLKYLITRAAVEELLENEDQKAEALSSPEEWPVFLRPSSDPDEEQRNAQAWEDALAHTRTRLKEEQVLTILKNFFPFVSKMRQYEPTEAARACLKWPSPERSKEAIQDIAAWLHRVGEEMEALTTPGVLRAVEDEAPRTHEEPD